MTMQIYLETALLAPRGERLKKGDLNKACLRHSQFAICGHGLFLMQSNNKKEKVHTHLQGCEKTKYSMLELY